MTLQDGTRSGVGLEGINVEWFGITLEDLSLT